MTTMAFTISLKSIYPQQPEPRHIWCAAFSITSLTYCATTPPNHPLISYVPAPATEQKRTSKSAPHRPLAALPSPFPCTHARPHPSIHPSIHPASSIIEHNPTSQKIRTNTASTPPPTQPTKPIAQPARAFCAAPASLPLCPSATTPTSIGLNAEANRRLTDWRLTNGRRGGRAGVGI
ncbi:hypothetical protein HDK64DRAFT_262336 [Phyllosticta capitalensis]